MCGRYAAAKDPDALVEEFEVDESLVDEPLAHDFNVAPTKRVYTVLQRRPKDSPAESAAPRQLRVAKWGLVPSWAKDPAIGSRMINARAETLADKPSYKRAFASRRCLLPADGYYEWYTPDQAGDAPRTAKGKPRKQPFFIHSADGASLAMAGLYEWWHDPSRDKEDPDSWLLTTTVITTDADETVAHIHDRMPLLIARTDWPTWLDPDLKDLDTLADLVAPGRGATLIAFPVSLAVNDVRHNGPELTEPLPLDDADHGIDEPRA
ncbi:MAG: SOS response-associated peptidase [Actinomycetes bacterium]